MSDLEQANAVLAEARAVLKKSEENLQKSIKANDLALVQHRELAYALSCLVHPLHTMTPLSELEEEELKQKLMQIPTQPLTFVPNEPVFVRGRLCGFVDCGDKHVEHREVYDIVNAINVLAMANTDVLLVRTTFLPDQSELVVSVEAKFKWQTFGVGLLKVEKAGGKVSLRNESALEELLSIESKLTELIIEAREEAEAQAEVN